MMPVNEIGLSSELESTTFSFGIGTISAFFHSSETYGKSSGQGNERFCFLKKLYTV